MPEDNNKRYVIGSMSGIRKLFGMTSQGPSESLKDVGELSRSKILTPGEIAILRGRTKTTNFSDDSSVDITSQLTATSNRISDGIVDSEAMRAMVPELRKIKSVFIPAIMCPNDMYSKSFNVSVDIPGVAEAQLAKINTLLNTFVNEKHNLGNKVAKWLNVAFDTGASPVAVIPRVLNTIASENGKLQITEEQLGVIREGLNLLPSSALEHIKDVDVSLESLSDFYPVENVDSKDNTKITEEAASLRDLLKEKLNSNVDFTLDITRLKDKDRTKRESENLASDRFNKAFGLTSNPKTLNLTNVDVEVTDSEPFMMVLPSTSCIPISLPGSPEEHIGYYVVTDKNGYPIRPPDKSCPVKEAVKDGQLATLDRLVAGEQGYENAHDTFISKVLNDLLCSLVDASMNSIGVPEVEMPADNALYSAIFSRALAENEVSLIYIPAKALAYYAFDYRKDGTGKPLMEDLSFIISMRTSYLVAKTMAEISQASDDYKISFDMDEKIGGSTEAIMKLLHDKFVSRKFYKFPHDPREASRAMIARNVSIIPSNLKGIQNLNVDVAADQGQSSSPDSEMGETYSNLIKLGSPVPGNVLDEVGDGNITATEVISENIIFSNTIRDTQQRICEITTVLVRELVRNSKSIVDELKVLITELSTEKDENDNTHNDLLDKVVSYIEVTLPPPNIAPAKLKFEELQDITNAMSDVMERLMPDEVITTDNDDEDALKALQANRAIILRQFLLDVFSRMGTFPVGDIREMEKQAIESSEKVNQRYVNLGANIQRIKAATTSEDTEDGDDQAW